MDVPLPKDDVATGPEPSDHQPEVIEVAIGSLHLDADGIVCASVNGSRLHDEVQAREFMAALHRAAAGVSRPVLGDISLVESGPTKAAREYYASQEGSAYILALGLVTASKLQRLIGNFFFTINRPTYPSRLFTDRDEAMAWLQGFLSS